MNLSDCLTKVHVFVYVQTSAKDGKEHLSDDDDL